MFALLILMASLANAAEPSKAPISNVCSWELKNPSPDQAKRLADIKKKSGCPEVKQ